MVRDADDVAWPGLIDDLALLSEKEDGVVHADHLAGAGLLQLHAAPKPPGTEAQERHAVAMVRVHIGLDFEDEAGDLVFRGLDLPRLRLLRPRRRRKATQRLKQAPHAEILQRRPEEDRRHMPTAIDRKIERRGGMAHQLHILLELCAHILRQIGKVGYARLALRELDE